MIGLIVSYMHSSYVTSLCGDMSPTHYVAETFNHYKRSVVQHKQPSIPHNVREPWTGKDLGFTTLSIRKNELMRLVRFVAELLHDTKHAE